MKRTILAGLLVSLAGCGQQPAPEAASKDEFLRTLQQELDAAAQTPPGELAITLPTVEGWSQRDPETLPDEEDRSSLSAAYNHPDGLAVTLYQIAYKDRSAPDDLDGELVRVELDRAKIGIEEMRKMGLWKSAREIETKTVPLGRSSQQVLRSRYELTTDNGPALSEIYVWPHAGRVFKLRCTQRSSTTPDNPKLVELLTALGEACRPGTKAADANVPKPSASKPE